MKQRNGFVANGESTDVKDLIKGYVDNGLSRRQFLAAITSLGLTATAASALADEFTPFVSRADEPPGPLPDWVRSKTGTGGQLLIAQLKAAKVDHFFVNPSSGHAPVFDALVDEPNVHIIKALHEGNLVAMADGYARASFKTPFIMIAHPGLPNAMTMMYNAWRDYTPMVVMTDDIPSNRQGYDAVQDMGDLTSMTQGMTKWHWNINNDKKITEDLRRAFKFAATRPSRPVFLAIPEDFLSSTSTAAIMEQDKFQVPLQITPDQSAIRMVAQQLLQAENPMILVGDEVRLCRAEEEVTELAELLGVTVTKDFLATWSMPFPSMHPLYLGRYIPTSRFPGKVDVLLNLGSRMPYAWGGILQVESTAKVLQIRVDPENLARVYPTDQAIFADIKLATTALIEEVNRLAPSQNGLKRIAGERLERARRHNKDRRAVLDAIAQKHWNDEPISGERLLSELETVLEKDSIIVSENDTYREPILNYLNFGPEHKDFFTTAGIALGWGLPAAFGIKMALPDRPVVCLVPDGAFLFSGPQPLWSYSRYKAPVLIIVMNNRSYNNERNRIMMHRGRAYEVGRDMACYLGDPDVDYVYLARGFGVEGETVEQASSIKSAVQRAQAATKEGRPYLLDVHLARTGSLATSTWHPEYDISALRNRKV